MNPLFSFALLIHILGAGGIMVGAVGYGLMSALLIRRAPSRAANVKQATAFVPYMKPLLAASTVALILSGGAMMAFKPDVLLRSGFTWVGLAATIGLAVNGAKVLEPWLMGLRKLALGAGEAVGLNRRQLETDGNDGGHIINLCCATGAIAAIVLMMVFRLNLGWSMAQLGAGLIVGFIWGFYLREHCTIWVVRDEAWPGDKH